MTTEAVAQHSFHPLRGRARYLAASYARDAQSFLLKQGLAFCTDRALAARWGLKSHHPISDLFNPASGKALALGDVLALPKELARAILVAALAALEDETQTDADPSETLAEITVAIGKAFEALKADANDNGKYDEPTAHASRLGRIAALALRGQRMAQRMVAGTPARGER